MSTGDINDLIEQLDILLKKLNSEYVDEGIVEVYTNFNDLLTKINNDSFIDGFNNFYHNLDNLVVSLDKLSNKSTFHIDDSDWRVNEVLIMLEIFLILLIVVIIVIFIFYLKKKYQDHKESYRKPLRVSSNLDTFLEKD